MGQQHIFGVSVFISGSSGIPKWIRPQKKGSEVVAKLPQDWYKDSDLLGFVLYSIYDPVLDNESEAGWKMDEETYFKCDLTLVGHESPLVANPWIKFICNCPDVMWIFYYPKVAIQKRFCSNKWKQLKTSFSGWSDGKAMKVKECGIHLIYASHAHEHNNPASAGESMIPTIELEYQHGELKSLTPLLCLGYSGFIRSFPGTLEDVENLKQLHLDGTAIEELPASIQHLKGLQFLNLDYCNNLVTLPESICNLKSLTTLSCIGCSNLREFPEILENMENFIKLDLDGSAIEALPSSIENLRGLRLLNLRLCNNLVSLPESICNLKSLRTLSCSGCSNLRELPEIRENMENLVMLDLDGSAIEGLPSSIENLQGLQFLSLTQCNNLRSLPSSICELKSLKYLCCSGCSQLRSFPEIFGEMGNLRKLHLNGTAIEELPESIQHLQGLQYLDLRYCNNLVGLPESIGYLKSLITLNCSSCSNLRVFPKISENMENLRRLYLSGTSIKELPSSIEHLRGLQYLSLENCSNLVNIPESICKLSSLEVINVNLCTKLEKFPENLGSLQRLEDLGVSGLNLSIECFSSIAADIIQLSKLRFLNLSHCTKLQRVPDLPPNLRVLDVHDCTCLENLSSLSRLLGFSMLKCFKSAIEVRMMFHNVILIYP